MKFAKRCSSFILTGKNLWQIILRYLYYKLYHFLVWHANRKIILCKNQTFFTFLIVKNKKQIEEKRQWKLWEQFQNSSKLNRASF